MVYDPIRQSVPDTNLASTSTTSVPTKYQSYTRPQDRSSQQMPPPAPKYPTLSTEPATASEAEMLLTLQNPPFSQHTSGSHHSFDHTPSLTPTNNTRHDVTLDFSHGSMFAGGHNGYMGQGGVGDMMMESQEIDVSALGGDMVPWLEYLPQDVLNFFDAGGNANVTLSSAAAGDLGGMGGSAG